MSAKVLTLLVCYLGGPGTPQQAEPVVDQFMRQIERAAGWKANSAQGVYRATLASCQAAMNRHRPNLLVVDLPAYLGQETAWKLRALAHMGTADKKRYHLLVRKGSGFRDLASLKGKVLLSTLADQPRFLSQMVLGGRVDAARHFRLAQTRRPLRGIRQVARGQAEAVIVDEQAFAHLEELSLSASLEAIHTSPALPDLTLAAVNGRTDKQLVAAIRRALPKLCMGPGAALCRTFGISAFTSAKAALYRQLVRRYRK